MYPSPRNQRHDPRWIVSSRTASFATLLLNAGLVFGLALAQTTSAPTALPQPLVLEFKTLETPEYSVPTPVDIPAVSPGPVSSGTTPEPRATVHAKSEPPSPKKRVTPVQPPQALPKKNGANPISPFHPEPSSIITPAEVMTQIDRPVVAATVPTASTTRNSTAPKTAQPSRSTDMDQVLAALTKLIERYRDYPKAAKRAGYEGVVIMEVYVDRNGVVTGWSLDQASAHHVLDKAAEKTFTRLTGHKIEGAELNDELRVLVPVKYELRSPS
jgi:protein TonB